MMLDEQETENCLAVTGDPQTKVSVMEGTGTAGTPYRCIRIKSCHLMLSSQTSISFKARSHIAQAGLKLALYLMISLSS